MADKLLKQFINEAIRYAKSVDDKKAIEEGHNFISNFGQDADKLLELASRFRHIADDAAEITESKEILKTAQERLDYLKSVRRGFKGRISDKETKISLKKLDEQIVEISRLKDKAVINNLDHKYDTIVENIFNSKEPSFVKLKDRVIVTGGKELSYIDYVAQVRHYQYVFYSMVKNPDHSLLEKYKLLATHNQVIDDLDYIDEYLMQEMNLDFKFKLKPCLPLKFTLNDIDEFAENLKCVAELARQITEHVINGTKVSYMMPELIKNENGDIVIQKTFDIWDRCLFVYELNKIKNQPIENDIKPKIDTIGREVVRKYGVFETMNVRELRKQIKEDYMLALQMIAKAENGSILA